MAMELLTGISMRVGQGPDEVLVLPVVILLGPVMKKLVAVMLRGAVMFSEAGVGNLPFEMVI
jgi:hypothetical protein